jgi:glyoxylase-like metal-dependent hydrolase (beta-lactamase superfamily II)
MLQKLSDNLTMVFTDYGFSYSNCLLIEDETNVLIESGAGKSLDDIEINKVDILLNTHHHFDHIRGNSSFPNAKILLHLLEHESMLKPEKMTATDGWNDLMPADLMDASQQTQATLEIYAALRRVDGEIVDGQVIDCGRTKFVVMHTPGHCAGHCSFWFPDEEIIFLGDICLTKAGPWYGETNADIDDLMASIDRMIALKPRRVTTSHITQVVDDPEPVLIEYKSRIFNREQRIMQSLKESPKNIHQLADQHLIYREHPTIFELFWEKFMIKKHLERLIKFGSVEAIENGLFHSIS